MVSGVHPIFGGFIAGLIIPHEGGFAIAVVEKIDDLVSLIFLPIVSPPFDHRVRLNYHSTSCCQGSQPIWDYWTRAKYGVIPFCFVSWLSSASSPAVPA
jgi:hypothetical protein